MFDFPMSDLLGNAHRFLTALRDTIAGPPVQKRLKSGFDAALAAQIALVEKGGGDQRTAGGALIELTKEQGLACTKMERLMGGARHANSDGDARQIKFKFRKRHAAFGNGGRFFMR